MKEEHEDKEVDKRDEGIEDEDNFDRLENIIEENLEGIVNGDDDTENVEMGQVQFPNTEADDEFIGDFKSDVAQQVGRFSDKVHMGSPSDEAGAIGQDALKDTIEKSREELAEKLNGAENDEE
ncbi:hypothetical protein [Acetohalobium arabaticum]|uniref:Uncharacterized protein n=1 Tax=Acetohalobium arabaticum (strain ATCC 49924 / DSM 5501 / Z-7288) TaxID=574087 RepID=D9QQE3_ACEAZ|nr:hypothetical protein [Acetohalobium arabaticum]ADL12734.1 hypothetical protein Acear_1215 [Acetohalobium arabaticum DSM 5501]